jgi:hypothetical protein
MPIEMQIVITTGPRDFQFSHSLGQKQTFNNSPFLVEPVDKVNRQMSSRHSNRLPSVGASDCNLDIQRKIDRNLSASFLPSDTRTLGRSMLKLN